MVWVTQPAAPDSQIRLAPMRPVQLRSAIKVREVAVLVPPHLLMASHVSALPESVTSMKQSLVTYGLFPACPTPHLFSSTLCSHSSWGIRSIRYWPPQNSHSSEKDGLETDSSRDAEETCSKVRGLQGLCWSKWAGVRGLPWGDDGVCPSHGLA